MLQAGISQDKSTSLNMDTRSLPFFRQDREKRDFVSPCAAAACFAAIRERRDSDKGEVVIAALYLTKLCRLWSSYLIQFVIQYFFVIKCFHAKLLSFL